MLIPDNRVPELDLPLTIKARFVLADQSPELFTMLVFYRGRHCPLCRKFLEEIGSRMDEITEAGLQPFAISMDSPERAQVAHDEWKTHDLPLAHSLTEEQAREWGLYISTRREDSEEPDRFSEPGLFLVRPDGRLYMAQVQSAPFTRPSIDQLLQGMRAVKKLDYPARGTAT